MPRGGKRQPSEGKKLGRPEKPKIEQFADKGIASTVLAQNGPPDHKRVCDCEQCKAKPDCTCVKGAKQENGERIFCADCRLRNEHAVCHCEVCGWWELLLARDKRIVHDTRKYLTDRRDGKPAQGVFMGDTRENAPPLTRGNFPSYFERPAHTAGPHKPN